MQKFLTIADVNNYCIANPQVRVILLTSQAFIALHQSVVDEMVTGIDSEGPFIRFAMVWVRPQTGFRLMSDIIKEGDR